jgi:hypothetical protein
LPTVVMESTHVAPLAAPRCTRGKIDRMFVAYCDVDGARDGRVCEPGASCLNLFG